MVQELRALQALQEVDNLVVGKLSSTVSCRDMLLVVVNGGRNAIFLLSKNAAKTITSPDILESVQNALERSDPKAEPKFCQGPMLTAVFAAEGIAGAARRAFLPLVQ